VGEKGGKRPGTRRRLERPTPSDRRSWTAEHPQPHPPDTIPDLDDLAPYASTGGHTPYSFPGGTIQEINFTKGLLRNRHWYNRAVGWLLLLGVIGLTVGIGLWRLAELLR
jgi:hypothetical protein